MDGAAAAGDEQSVGAGIAAVLGDMDAGGAGHGLVDERVDAGGGFGHGQAEPGADGFDGGGGGGGVDADGTAGEVRGI